jgi:multiple sugar transport system substrate-binding protein
MYKNIIAGLKKLFPSRFRIVLAAVLIVFSSFIVYSLYVNLFKEKSEKDNFPWDLAKGEEIEVYFSQHPYVEAIINRLPEFQKKTGIKVNYSIIPEEYYFEKLSANLRKFRSPDAFMLGPYYIWEYAAKGYIQDLNYFLKQSKITDPDYDINDFYPNVMNALKWDAYPGHATGSGGLWAVPMGFEVFPLAYNKRIFQERGLKPPHTMEELLELCKVLDEFDGKGTYALALRGARNWATINTSYITTYANYGAKDFEIQNGKLISRVNSKEALEMTDMWVKLVRAGGAPELEKYTWYQASADFGAGKAAMLFDADNVGYYQNPFGESKESGNIAWIQAPIPEGSKVRKSNLWTWALAISSSSRHKEATWLFLQYFTSKEYTSWASQNFKLVDPARKSVLESKKFQRLLSNAEGYSEVLSSTINNAEVQFTPQPHFIKVSTEWSQTLQDIILGKYKSTKEGMDSLKQKIDDMVKDVKVQ